MTYAARVTQELQSKGLSLPIFGGEQSLGSLYVNDPMVGREVSADVMMVDFPQGPSLHQDIIGLLHGVDVPRDPEQPLQLHFVQSAHGSHGDLAGHVGINHQEGVDVRLRGPGSRLTKMATTYAIGSRVPGIDNLIHVNFDRRNLNRRYIATRTTLALSRAAITLVGAHMFSSLPANERDTTSLMLFVGRIQTGEYEGRLSAANASNFDLTRVTY